MPGLAAEIEKRFRLAAPLVDFLNAPLVRAGAAAPSVDRRKAARIDAHCAAACARGTRLHGSEAAERQNPSQMRADRGFQRSPSQKIGQKSAFSREMPGKTAKNLWKRGFCH